jgi:hypothetical protein
MPVGEPREVQSRPQGSDSRALGGTSRLPGLVPADLPDPLVTPTGGPTCFFRAEDDPIDENSAHAEIRVHRQGVGYSSKYQPGPTTKTRLRELLAAKLQNCSPIRVALDLACWHLRLRRRPRPARRGRRCVQGRRLISPRSTTALKTPAAVSK